MKFWITIKDGLGAIIHGPEMGEFMEYEYAEERGQELMLEHDGVTFDISDEPPENEG